jgi:hypothetical protein
MTPVFGALISVSIFMASKISTVASIDTDSPSAAISLKIFPPNGASITVPTPALAATGIETSFCAELSLIITELSAFKVTEYS